MKRAAETALQGLGMRNPSSIEPMSLIPREERERKDEQEEGDPLLLKKALVILVKLG